MKLKRVLFTGAYPNPVSENLNVFFRNIIYAIADKGIECYVIAPVSVTGYGSNIKKIPEYITETTPNGNIVKVYHPRTISVSAKNIFNIYNTIHIMQNSVNHAVYRTYKKLDIEFDAVYGHFFTNGGFAASYIGRKTGIPVFIANGESSEILYDILDGKDVGTTFCAG